MNILIKVICLIICGAVLLEIGCLAGVNFQEQKTASRIAELEKMENMVKILASSKVIPSIVAYGQVASISGKVVILAYGTESLAIPIREDAKIYSFVTSTNQQGPPEQKKAELKDIKIGDSLNVSLRILPDGGIEGVSVIIFPSVGSK